jgi:hypothetical protein
MLKLMIRCTWFESNYNSITCQNSENVTIVVQVFRKKEK